MVSESKQKILIVDDEPLNLNVLNDLLKEDYDIYLAKSGIQAQKRIAANHPDLILLDVMMPEMDGYETCRRIKSEETTKNIPIIFITALDSLENEEKGLLLGAVDYIAKPFHAPIVKARVKNILTLVRQRNLLERMAKLDGLTEIPNRWSFEESITREWHRCSRNGSPLSLAMLDLDYFKQFNDNYGHLSGDEALKSVALSLLANLQRSADMAARYGGEEFVMLMPDTDSEGAALVAAKILSVIKSLRIPHDFSDISPYLTVSIGGATMVPAGHDSATTLISKADDMLYQAKLKGRNQVVWTDGSGD